MSGEWVCECESIQATSGVAALTLTLTLSTRTPTPPSDSIFSFPDYGVVGLRYVSSYLTIDSLMIRMATSLFSHPSTWTRLPSRSL